MKLEKGLIFGRLEVVDYSHTDKHRKRVYQCLCQCGKTTYVIGFDLKSGNTTSCGCAYREKKYLKGRGMVCLKFVMR